VIGEVSFLKGVKRTATVIAKSNSRVAELSGLKAKEIFKSLYVNFWRLLINNIKKEKY